MNIEYLNKVISQAINIIFTGSSEDKERAKKELSFALDMKEKEEAKLAEQNKEKENKEKNGDL